MKALIFSAVLMTTPAFAASPVYTAEAAYTKPGWDSKWSQLEQAGIERAAEKKAYAKCAQAGSSDCVILEGAHVVQCGYMTGGGSGSGCKAEAYARGKAE